MIQSDIGSVPFPGSLSIGTNTKILLLLLYKFCCFILLWLPSVLHELSIDTGGIDEVMYLSTLATRIRYV